MIAGTPQGAAENVNGEPVSEQSPGADRARNVSASPRAAATRAPQGRSRSMSTGVSKPKKLFQSDGRSLSGGISNQTSPLLPRGAGTAARSESPCPHGFHIVYRLCLVGEQDIRTCPTDASPCVRDAGVLNLSNNGCLSVRYALKLLLQVDAETGNPVLLGNGT